MTVTCRLLESCVWCNDRLFPRTELPRTPTQFWLPKRNSVSFVVMIKGRSRYFSWATRSMGQRSQSIL